MNKRKFRRLRLSILFSFMVCAIIMLTMSLVSGGMYALYHFNIVDGAQLKKLPIFLFSLICIILGTVIAMIIGHRSLASLQEIVDGLNKIAKGEYDIRIKSKKRDEFHQLVDSFNHMAKEIGSVEMLKTDFINNFSHEFKTPIVSIQGFAKMLKHKYITIAEKNDYIDIIISESERLAELSTNVLNLSKIEQQAIIKDKTNYNIAEQIRLAIALMEAKWASKYLQINYESGEVYILANQEMLQQVWINLLDNAIKFSPEHGIIKILITQSDQSIRVAFHNQGNYINQDAISHIFDKFYQVDSSRNVNGYGLGLSIIKRIVELHHGSISVCSSQDEGTCFTVNLPFMRLNEN